MSGIRKISTLAGAAIAGFAITSPLHAAIVASDSASNSPYSTVGGSNNYNGQNGSSISPAGYGPWAVTNSVGDSSGGVFISASTNDATRNPAPVFDLFDNGSPSTSTTLGSSIETATRPFVTHLTGSGSSFSFVESLASLRAMSAGTPTSQVGFELLDSAGVVLLNLYVNGGGTGYFAADASNSGTPYALSETDSGHPGRNLDINSGAADTILITLNDDNGDYTITTGGHRAGTYADGGRIDMSTGGPAAFAFYDNNGGNGSDVRINNLVETVVPEPVGMAAAGLISTLLLRRRTRK